MKFFLRLFTAVCCLFCLTLPALANNAWVEVKGGDWKPFQETLSEIQQNIESYVRNNAEKQQRDPVREWNTYIFQFQGQRAGKDGQKFVFINALCHVHRNSDLSLRFADVFDGGACYFQLKYDPEKNEFYDLSINGLA
jgi:hypothetical protein